MLHIKKNKVPDKVANFSRRAFDSSVGGKKRFKLLKNNKPRSIQLQKSILDEQKGFCCYCMSSIRRPYSGNDNAADRMNIEHFEPKSLVPRKSVDYSNLLGSCNRHINRQGVICKTCDPHKGAKILRFIINPSHPNRSKYYETMKLNYVAGEILSGDPAIAKELKDKLNLNEDEVVSMRMAAINKINAMVKGKSDMDKKKIYDEFINMWKLKKDVAQCFDIIVYYFENKIIRTSPNYGKKFLNPHYI